MKRNEFLQTLGLIGAASMVPSPKIWAKTAAALPSKLANFPPPTCFLAPAVPQGPFYFNTNLIRQNIAEDRTGIPIRYDFMVVDINCNPIPNAVVDIWHCDKDGIYSAYSSQGTAGKTWLRGGFLTDANGFCSFNSIYPGWYNGRLAHLHVKIHLNNNTYVTTIFFYEPLVNQSVYGTPLYTKGQNPVTVAQDIELKGDTGKFNQLLMTFSGNPTDGIVATYTAGINTTVAAHETSDAETGGQFWLRQNFPNPMEGVTTVKFALLQPSRVDFELFDLNRQLVARLIDNERI